MTEIGFFPPPRYAPGRFVTFKEPEHAEWTVINKINQQNSQKDEVDIKAGSRPSYVSATFRVRSILNSQDALMRVYLQVPNKGTEFFPLDERATQAASGYHREFEAMKTFHEQKSTITPALLALAEDIQESQGLIPGGYLIQFVFKIVHGIGLADDRRVSRWGAPLHTFFQKFSDEKRKQIRTHFDREYRKLEDLGWIPYFPWVANLIWDGSATRLYFVDFRDARKIGVRDKDVIEGGDKKLDKKEVPKQESGESGVLLLRLLIPRTEETFPNRRSSYFAIHTPLEIAATPFYKHLEYPN